MTPSRGYGDEAKGLYSSLGIDPTACGFGGFVPYDGRRFAEREWNAPANAGDHTGTVGSR